MFDFREEIDSPAQHWPSRPTHLAGYGRRG